MLVNDVEIKGLKKFKHEDWVDESFEKAMEEKYSFFLDSSNNHLYISMNTLKPFMNEKVFYEHPDSFYWNYSQDDGLYVIPLKVLLKDEQYTCVLSEFIRDLEAYVV